MSSTFLLYGANGFVGKEAARLAAKSGLRPILAGRNATALKELASELDLEYRVFSLDDYNAIDRALQDIPVVLHCAGPYIYTSNPMVESCIRTGTNYMDITGEIPVYEALASKDEDAKSNGVMLLPDGEMIAYSDYDDYLHVINTDGSEHKEIYEGTQCFSQITWSPDSKSIFYLNQGYTGNPTLYEIYVRDSCCHKNTINSLEWKEDIFNGLFLMHKDGSDLRCISSNDRFFSKICMKSNY